MNDIVATLKRGGVVLMPTDTIYGLHALATNVDAVRRIVEMKGRGDEKPFVVIGSSRAQLEQLGAIFSDELRPALDELWPGPLTAIVPLRQPIAASNTAAATPSIRPGSQPCSSDTPCRYGPAGASASKEMLHATSLW